jgi:hypothetical protein
MTQMSQDNNTSIANLQDAANSVAVARGLVERSEESWLAGKRLVAKCTRADNALQKQERMLLRGKVTLTVGVSWQRPICKKQEEVSGAVT